MFRSLVIVAALAALATFFFGNVNVAEAGNCLLCGKNGPTHWVNPNLLTPAERAQMSIRAAPRPKCGCVFKTYRADGAFVHNPIVFGPDGGYFKCPQNKSSGRHCKNCTAWARGHRGRVPSEVARLGNNPVARTMPSGTGMYVPSCAPGSWCQDGSGTFDAYNFGTTRVR